MCKYASVTCMHYIYIYININTHMNIYIYIYIYVFIYLCNEKDRHTHTRTHAQTSSRAPVSWYIDVCCHICQLGRLYLLNSIHRKGRSERKRASKREKKQRSCGLNLRLELPEQ